ncbi:polysaccharide pyruvyl transferase family protein [Aureimonas mangrovi]|uniref:polysaccharide pyruvyl transferase family protein n=1 Tax=Aureimonas mangrovi TaxID=2758041 RepID=UPI00163DD6CA|nr:polysaccharide pyruvyl transferase family protein [Aureimonas mangrovi]
MSAIPSTIERETHEALIARLRGLIDEKLAPARAAARGTPFALLDYPDHPNVGDSAIWLGETAWMRDALGAMPAYVCRQEADWQTLDRLVPEGPIFLHGGGNFGDLWPQHQLFREEVLERYSGRTVIQLPQSIHYRDPAAIERTARVIAAHGAFALLVRDEKSLALARERFDCTVALCPDMAFCIGAQKRPAPQIPVLLLLRTDLERSTAALDPADLPAGWEMDDWLVDEPGLYPHALKATRIDALKTLDPRQWSRPARETRYLETLAQMRFDRGIAMLSRARFVITDRLHVHILSTLLGLPHVFLDNSYGKIRGLSDAFGTRWEGADHAETLEEAIALAKARTAG